MSETQTVKKVDVCKDKYPPSPEPDFKIPPEPDDQYFKHLPINIKQPILDKREAAKLKATETKETTLAAAEDEKQIAQSAYDVASGKFQTAKKLLILKSSNKKKQYWRDYEQSLRDSVSSNQDCSQHDDEKHVPAAKKAISIATLNLNLAKEEIDYRANYQKFHDELASAENTWKLAIDKYDAAACMAKAQEVSDNYSAEATFRQDLSDALGKLKNNSM